MHPPNHWSIPSPDPFDFRVPGTGTTVEFYGYHGHLDVDSIITCYLAALTEAVRHIDRGEGGLRMGTHARTWISADGKAYMFVRPRDEMTWSMLNWLCDGVQHFVLIQENHIQFQFLLLADGAEGEVGLGQIGAYHRPIN